MANRYSVASGLASDVATWDGGASVPVQGDRVLITRKSTGLRAFSTNTAGYAIGATAITLTGSVLAGSYVVGEAVQFGTDPNYYNITAWNNTTKVLTVDPLIVAIPAAATVVVCCGHVVELDGDYTWGDDLTTTITINTISTNRSIFVLGTLVHSRTVNSSLTGYGTLSIQAGGGIEAGTVASPIPQGVTATLFSNKSAAPVLGKYIIEVLPNSRASLVGVTRKRWTTLTSAVSVSDTSLQVADATGWQVGDRIHLVSDNHGTAVAGYELLTIAAGYVSGDLTVPLVSATTKTHRVGLPLGNLTSNVMITSYSTAARGGCNFQVHATEALNTRVLSNVKFLNLTGSYPYQLGVAFSRTDQYVAIPLVNPYTAIDSCVFTVDLSGQQSVLTTDLGANPYYATQPVVSNSVMAPDYIFSNGAGQNAVYVGSQWLMDTCLFSATSTIHPASFDSEVRDSWYVGCNTSAGMTSVSNGMANTCTFVRCKFSGTNSSVHSAAWAVARHTYEDCDIGVTYPLTSTKMYNIAVGPSSTTALLTNCKVSPRVFITTEQNTGNLGPTAAIRIRNRNSDVTLHEDYFATNTALRDNAVFNRGRSSLNIKPTTLLTDAVRTSKILCAAGGSIRVIGYVRADTAFYNGGGSNWTPPTVTISGLGITPVVFTASAAANNAWEQFDLTATNSSPSDGELTLSYTVNPKLVTTGSVYFDGVPEAPFITKVRHYGFMFDEASPTRTVNAAISASEATAATYSGVTVTWGTSTSPVTLTANQTFQTLYDYTQYQSVLPTNSANVVPLTGVGVAGSPSLFAAGNVTATGFTLNGGGSLSMGVYTLTGSIPWAYTYTGGTFSQDTTAPSFSGGSLTLSTTGVKNFTISGGTITFTTAGAYDLSGTSFSGTTTLINTSGGTVNLTVSGAPSFVNTGPNINVIAPTITQGLSFTGLVAGSELKIFAAGTQTVINTVGSSGTSHTWSATYTGDVTVDYTILKNGYVPIRVTGVLVQQSVIAVSVQQVVDVVYAASSAVTSSVNTGTSRFTIGSATTGQNFYSYWVEQWKSNGTLANVAFPFTTNGPNSIRLNGGWEITSGLNYWSRDGLSYWNAGVRTAAWAAILTSGTAAGHQVRYLQADAGAAADAQNTGPMDQLVAIYGDASHGGPFDYSNFLILKIQKDGFDQAEVDICGTYGTLEDQLYVAGLAATANGVASDATARTITITDSPVTWNSKTFSLTIDATGVTGLQLMQYLRYNTQLAPAFKGKPAFSWHDLVQVNGSKFKTVRGAIYGDTGAPLKGVRVLSGGSAHPDFDVMMADDGTVYNVPVTQSFTVTNLVSGSFVQIYDVTNSVELAQGTSTTTFSWTDSGPATGNRQIRLRIAYCSGVTAKQFIEVANAGVVDTTVAGASKSYSASQVDDTVYIVNGVDGSLVTGITINDSIDKVVINIAGGTVSWKTIYAKNVHWLSTSAGIVDDGAFMAAIDPANYTLTGFKIRNSATGIPLTITDGYGRDTVTGTAAGCIDNTGSTGNIYAVPDQVISYATSGGSGLSPAESTKLMSLPDATTVATATLNAATAAPIAANVKKVNDISIAGIGTAGNPWGPV